MELIAQKKAIEHFEFDEFNDMKNKKKREIKEYLFDKFDQDKRNIEIENLLNASVSSKSESNLSSDKSIVNEFWEDFDFQNKLRADKAKFKFIDLDDPFQTNAKELKTT